MCDLLEQKRFFLWPEIFPFVTICGQEYFALRSEQKRDVLWSGRVGTFCDVLWPETFCDRPFCGQDFFLRTGRSVSGLSCTQALWLHSAA